MLSISLSFLSLPILTWTSHEIHIPSCALTAILMISIAFVYQWIPTRILTPNKPKISLSASQLLDFLMLVGQIKTTKRTGWVRSGVKLPESVSDHMYRMSIMAWILSQVTVDNHESEQLDPIHVMSIALVHDLAEAIVGDIAPSDNVPKSEKHRLESEAMLRIITPLSQDAQHPSHIAASLHKLWVEYESNTTSSAKFVKDIDKLEMIIQAYEYESSQHLDLPSFYESTRNKMNHPLIQQIAHELEKRRNDMMKQRQQKET